MRSAHGACGRAQSCMRPACHRRKAAVHMRQRSLSKEVPRVPRCAPRGRGVRERPGAHTRPDAARARAAPRTVIAWRPSSLTGVPGSPASSSLGVVTRGFRGSSADRNWAATGRAATMAAASAAASRSGRRPRPQWPGAAPAITPWQVGGRGREVTDRAAGRQRGRCAGAEGAARLRAGSRAGHGEPLATTGC